MKAQLQYNNSNSTGLSLLSALFFPSTSSNINTTLMEQLEIDETDYLMSSKKTYETIQHSLKSKGGTTYNSLKDFANTYKIHI